jgi:hypothetical protein
MIRKWLLILRDFSHVTLKRSNKTEQTTYVIMMGLVLYPYYIILMCCFILIPLGGIGLSLKGTLINPLIHLLCAILFTLPHIYAIKYLNRWLASTPLPDELPRGKYRRYMMIFALSILLIFALLPYAVNTSFYLVRGYWPR